MTVHTASQDFTAFTCPHVRRRGRAAVDRKALLVEACTRFPFGVAEYLAECREDGLSFEEAWTRDLDRAAIARGFTWKSRIGHVEASLPFARRHFRAAYVGELSHLYCVVTTCVELTCDEYGLCDVHATYREATAA